MKTFAALSACLLLAISQVGAQPLDKRQSESFSQLVANRTESMLSRDENPSTLNTLAYKTSAMFLAANQLHVPLPAQGLLSDVTYTATRFLIPTKALADIQELQKSILMSLNYLDNQRPADSSSEINKLIDEFINEYTEKASVTFENMYALSVNASEAAEPVAANLLTLVDELVEKFDACLNIDATAFRQFFQCNREYYSVESRMTAELEELRNAADKLDSDYKNEWNPFLLDFNDKLMQLREQAWQLRA